MTINVKAMDVVQPQHLQAKVGDIDTDQTQDRRITIYTGWVRATHGAGLQLTFQDTASFLLLGQPDDPPNDPWELEPTPREIFLYPPDPATGKAPELTAVVTASPSVLEVGPGGIELWAVDSATARLERMLFPNVGAPQFAFVLRIRLSARGARIHRIAYQVTVLEPNVRRTTVEVKADDTPTQFLAPA